MAVGGDWMVPPDTAAGPIATAASGHARVSLASRVILSRLFCTSTFRNPVTAMPTL